ncbi:MAG: hypothetical protein SCH98_17560 [Deferrisomatales bacterium]|nr:hypothetical protein [Deferrisomatales bacterium]
MNPLRDLVGELLRLEGALVEHVEPEGLEILAPVPIQRALDLPEWSRLGFGAELPDEARRLSLESEWLGRLGNLLGEGGRTLARTLPRSVSAPGDPERVLQHGLALTNATYRLRGVTPAWTRYLVFTFRYSAVSDEKREGLLHFGVNTANGATLDDWVEPLLALALPPGSAEAAVRPEPEKPPPAEALPAPWQAERLAAVLDRAVPPRVRSRLEPFLAGMARRQERDLARVRRYYGELRAEALERLNRFESAPDPTEKHRAGAERERQRLEAVAREYRAKVADLGQKYAVTVTLEWVQTLELLSPVERFDVLVKRRKGERRIALDWNPWVKRLEQAPCEYAHSWDRTRAVCDEALHLVSPAAHGPCPGCGKELCRACHPAKCPKCSRPSALPDPR